MKHSSSPIILTIIDGYGITDHQEHNAIFHAATPNLDFLFQTYPNSLLQASGEHVGLPKGQAGNSDIGHTIIGTGQVLKQELPLIDELLDNDYFASNSDFLQFIHSATTIHLMGISSDGGVHGHLRHILRFIKIIKTQKPESKILLHLILDGRDTPPRKALDYLKQFEPLLSDNVKIATISGRYYAMDRDQNLDRTENYYNTLTGKGPDIKDIDSYITSEYAAGNSDEFIKPVTIAGFAGIKSGEALFCTNYRADRVRQILAKLLHGKNKIDFVSAIGLKDYAEDLTEIKNIIPKKEFQPPVSAILSQHGKKQLKIAESEKFAHVTYFFNGGRESPYPGEDHKIIESSKAANYANDPVMRAEEICQYTIKALPNYDFIVINFANLDMVGHTGNFAATVKAAEEIDKQIGKLYQAAMANNATLMITSDHGNAEAMYDKKTGQNHCSHTSSPVPLIIAQKYSKIPKLKNGSLSDIAPTILSLSNIEIPDYMHGKNLLKR